MPGPDAARAAAILADIGPLLPALASPALVVDLAAVDHNIAAVLRRCHGDAAGPSSGRADGCIGSSGSDRWRPHVKTLKSAALVRRLWAAGVTRCKCATLDELQMLLDAAAEDGREDSLDVLLAYPLHEAAFHAVVALAGAHPAARVQLLADSPEHALALDAWAARAGLARPLDLHLDVDLGMGRTGSPPPMWRDSVARLAALSRCRVAGLHGYDGHLAWSQTIEAAAAYDVLCDLAAAFACIGTDLELITSGTHSFLAALAHPRLAAGPWHHRISPGTVVLSDLRSHPAAEALGLQQAAWVLARVVSRGPDRVTLDAGSKAIAPDRPAPNCRLPAWPGLVPLKPSEEHLPLRREHGALPDHGAPVLLVPDHVCTTVNLYRECLLLRPGSSPVRAPIGAQGHRLFLASEGSPA
ncbi:alanine racemase [Nannocystis radixulma]|uniref:Alanine racemase n=1 Tax=Nannocystis radixulma TaxID=2995305 RepID=A0ABT5AZA4_9BACT|nr:alanine racemase [Nannocystis radixulma]MDC0667172.1 alanine racemase [Nannocystis radixulma]